MSELIKPKLDKRVFEIMQDTGCDAINICPNGLCKVCIFDAPIDEFKEYLKAELEREE